MASKDKNLLRILITTGDPDGIGWEVTAKALQALGPKPGVQIFFYRHVSAANTKPGVPRKFKYKVAASLKHAMAEPFDPRLLVEIRSPKSPAHWVEEAADACLAKEFQALVTAPLSKTSIIDAGFKDIGHTEILARRSGRPHLHMGFLGRKFSVVLLTGHQPLQQAVNEFSAWQLESGARAGAELKRLLPKGKRDLPMALVGVNPHAGERGLLGGQEQWMSAELPKLIEHFGPINGPLVPDAAFLPVNQKLHSVYLCPYHDQGLIPFKMVHGFEGGVHLTLGLPFVRTSVDHGTAKELFGRGVAQSGSMQDALKTAIQLAKEKTHGE